ncbi:MAG: 50S ribosomal protein L4 [Candidatus Omnitrophica bacterium]|nr:50S ribosomal protein L4 [Candidatus Omnitrophota bacterium]
MKEIEVLNQEGEKIGNFTLDEKVFDGKVNITLIHQAVVTYLANRRKGIASTKTKSEVRGGGAKPWRQKGTGRARVGSIRSPLWRGGGIIFGPKPRDYSKKLPKKMKIGALKSALNAKLKDKEIVVVDGINLENYKTKSLLSILKKLKINSERVKLVVPTIEKNLKLASRNLEKVETETADNLNAYTALDCKKIIFTKQALEKIQERIKKFLS